MGRKSMILGLIWLLGAAAPPPDGSRLKLEGEYIGMATVRQAEATSQLAVFGADQHEPRRRRFVELFDKRAGTLTKSPTVPLPDDAAAYDVCRLAPASPAETIVLVRRDGVYRLGDTQPLVRAPTLFPVGRDDALPRLKLCFALFAVPGAASAEPAAIVLPELGGVAVYRQATPGIYARHATMRVDPELGFQLQLLRGVDLAEVQRVSVRFQFPDVTAQDMNGDGAADLCFSASDHLACHLQDAAARAFRDQAPVEHRFRVLTPAEKADTSLRVTSRLLDLSGDGRPDMVIAKSTWNLSSPGATVKLFVQRQDGTFPATPTQAVTRDGYFAYQEFLDFDGDGLKDLVAPVASLGWTDIAALYLSRQADIDFVWYRNAGGRFEPRARALHSVTFPVEFKNMGAILGALPLWDVRLTATAPKAGERHILFFPRQAGLDLRVATVDGVGATPLWRRTAELGSSTAAVDLDGDGRHEIISAYPKDPRRAGSLLFLDPSAEASGAK